MSGNQFDLSDSKMEWGYVRREGEAPTHVRVVPNRQHAIFEEKTETVKVVKAKLDGVKTVWNLEKGHVQFRIPEGMEEKKLENWAENKAITLIAFLERGEIDFLAVKDDNDDYGDNKTLGELIESAWLEWTHSLEHPTYDSD